MEPLDRQQEQRLAEIKKGTWITSPARLFVLGTMFGLAVFGGVAAGIVASGVAWPLPIGIVLVLALVLGIGASKLGPDRVLTTLVRSELPSEVDYKRGLRAFQRDGGRVWAVGEKPPPKYWDTWAPKETPCSKAPSTEDD